MQGYWPSWQSGWWSCTGFRQVGGACSNTSSYVIKGAVSTLPSYNSECLKDTLVLGGFFAEICPNVYYSCRAKTLRYLLYRRYIEVSLLRPFQNCPWIFQIMYNVRSKWRCINWLSVWSGTTYVEGKGQPVITSECIFHFRSLWKKSSLMIWWRYWRCAKNSVRTSRMGLEWNSHWLY